MEDFLNLIEELIHPRELPWKVDYHNSTLGFNVVATSTKPIENFITMDVIAHWALLGKPWDYWKAKYHNATTWAFFAPIIIDGSSYEVSSNKTLRKLVSL